eukprot:GEMP01072425.1.p1 GENE.GEMP01072425.1~~GEMP01072425.1.p1  ORF type:complete len:182 (+),score=26.47 GEMP01072425.1:63-608(+)
MAKAENKYTTDELKYLGNESYKEGDFEGAIEYYTTAIEQAGSKDRCVLFSNRSAAYARLDKYEKSLEDASRSLAIDPKFMKGYARKGLALTRLDKLGAAKAAYVAGLQIDSANSALLNGLQDIKELQRPPPNRERTSVSSSLKSYLKAMVNPLNLRFHYWLAYVVAVMSMLSVVYSTLDWY